MADYNKRPGFIFPLKTWEKILPIVISFSLPWLNFINNTPYREETRLEVLFPRLLIGSVYLLVIWYTNQYFFIKHKGNKLPIKLIAENVFMIFILVICLHFFVKEKLIWGQTIIPWLLIFKLMMGSFIILTIQGALNANKTNAQLKTENYALQLENYKSQLEQLKKQVNPHFLFNSLSVLLTMIRSKNVHSEEFVLNLSNVYRQLLQTRESNVVTLREELEFLNAYLYLLKVRHDRALEVTINTINTSHDYSIPVFALQLLIENCTKHNIVSEKLPLKIDIIQHDSQNITIKNNFQPKKTVSSFGVGLQNLNKRYELIGITDGVKIDQNEESYSVTIKLF